MTTIPNAFLQYACDILGDTENGFSTSKILKLSVQYSIEYNIDIPHTNLPITAPNKRVALYENLQKFTSEQQYKILRDLSKDPLQCDRPETKTLVSQLVTRYGSLSTEETGFDLALSKESEHWLSAYPKSLNLYLQALEKRKEKIYERNTLDDLRLALELLLKDIFNNEKSLENQKNHFGDLVNKAGGTTEFTNMFIKLLDYFCKYQNEHVKHDDKVAEIETDFIIDLTSSFMKAIIRSASIK